MQQSLFGSAPSAERPTPATPRDRAIDWAIRMVNDPNVVYLDTETTGLKGDVGICDIGIIAADGLVLIDSLVKPHVPIPAEAAAVHGISNEMVAEAPTWIDIVDQVRDAVRDKIVVVYNLQYDLPLINQVCAKLKVEPISNVIAGRGCAMLAYGDWEGTPSQFGSGPKWWKLDAAAKNFGIPPGGHRALNDARTARLVVLGMAQAVGE